MSASDAQEEGSEAMYTDIVKARAIRRAGRACEMCGTPLSFDSARFVSAHPIFGVLFDQDDCCVLCLECLEELDVETRAAAEEQTPGDREPDRSPQDAATREDVAVDDERGEVGPTAHAAGGDSLGPPPHQQGPELPRAAREAWFSHRDPDDDICA
jgi:hypothetical protein